LFLFLSVKAFFLFDKLPKEVWREDESSDSSEFSKEKERVQGKRKEKCEADQENIDEKRDNNLQM
ncbi:MAG: hypothetical protein AB1485_09500, partial [Candidatus Thermoplasmatota archaeon]